MSRTQRSILVFLAVIACGLIVVVGWVGYQTYLSLWQAPLGPSIAMPASTPWSLPPTWTPSLPAMTPLFGTPQATSTWPPTSTPQLMARCGAPPVMLLLAVGSDARSNTYTYGLADVIRIVRVDFINARVTILEFPRDLWVEIPEIADNINGQDHEKLNQSYLYGNPGFGYYEGPGQGPGLLSRTLALNFGVSPDHYIAVNMRTFESIINAVGGIDVTLEESVDGRTSNDTSKRLYFPTGEQHLNGVQALTLARLRPEGVFQRADNQDIVMCALKEKLTTPKVITRIPDIINSFKDNVQTDLTPESIAQLACIGPQIKSENILFAKFPRDLFTNVRIYDPVFKKNVLTWDVDFEVLRDYTSRFIQGTWPTPNLEGTASNEPEAASCQ